VAEAEGAPLMANATDNPVTGWQPEPVAVNFAEEVRGGSLSSQISRAVALALRLCGQPRETVAAAMSAYLGEKVSRAMLDAYASEARADHRISLERFIALIEATGRFELLGFVAKNFGHSVVPDRYAAIIELHLIEEHEQALAERKAVLRRIAREGT
jgi:hypothetical protein